MSQVEQPPSTSSCLSAKRPARCFEAITKMIFLLASPSTIFYRAHLLYIVVICVLAGAFIFAIEGSGTAPFHYIDCIFIVTAAVTGGGLQTFDITHSRIGSQVVIVLVTLCGGVVFLSVVPVTYRRVIIWRASRDALGCHTGLEPRLSEYLGTHLEYRALGWIRVITLTYWAVSQVVVWLALGTYLSVFPGSAALASQANVWWFAWFISTAAFANTGLVPLVSVGAFCSVRLVPMSLPSAAPLRSLTA